MFTKWQQTRLFKLTIFWRCSSVNYTPSDDLANSLVIYFFASHFCHNLSLRCAKKLLDSVKAFERYKQKCELAPFFGQAVGYIALTSTSVVEKPIWFSVIRNRPLMLREYDESLYQKLSIAYLLIWFVLILVFFLFYVCTSCTS